MKKYFYSVLAAASMMLAVTSCSQEEDFAPSSGEMTTFSVQLTGATQSRAVGEGEEIDKLYYEVWSENGENSIIEQKNVPVVNGKATVALPLMKHKKYDIIFWAQSSDNSIYTVSNGLKNITVNYGENGIDGNNENNDAFFNALDNFEAKGENKDIELRRPFAQLNIGTSMDDWNEAARQLTANGGTEGDHGVDAITVIVEGLADTFNAMTGEAGKSDENYKTATFVKGELQDGQFVTNGKEYKYLAMNYLLVPGTKKPQGLEAHIADPKDDATAEAKALVDITFTLHNGETEYSVTNVPSAPIQRNYRTNIIGDFLTGDHSIFEVTIRPEFDEPAYTTNDALLEVLENGGDITLYSNLTLNESITVPADKAANINLNGYTLTVNSTNYVNGDLTISNGQVEIDIEGEDDLKIAFVANNGSTVDLNDATVTVADKSAAVYVPTSDVEATININNTVMTVAGDGHGVSATQGAKDLKINVTESTLSGTYAFYLMQTNSTVIIDEKSEIKDFWVMGGNVKVVYAGEKPEIKTDGLANTITYYTKEKWDLMETLENGGEMTLSSDMTLDEALVVAKDTEAKIDLGGNTLTVASNNKVEGTLNISNGTIATDMSGRGNAFETVGADAIVNFDNVNMTVTGSNNGVTVESWGTNPDAEAEINFNNTKINVEGSNGHAVFVTHYVKNLAINVTNGSNITGNQAIFIEKADNAVIYIDATSSVSKITALYGNVTVICENTTATPVTEGSANFTVYASQSEYDFVKVFEEGGETTLESDISMTESFTVPADTDTKINLNNNTLTVESSVVVEGSLTVSGGDVEVGVQSNGIAFETVGNSSVEITDANLTILNKNAAAVAVDCSNGSNPNAEAVVNIKGTEITAGNGFGVWVPFTAKKVEINVIEGSKITGSRAIFLGSVTEAIITIDATSSVEKIIAESGNLTIKYAGDEQPTVEGAATVTYVKI